MLFCACLYAQVGGDFQPKTPDFVPPSPTAFELGKYGDIPVNESTGMANVSVPLYSFSTPNISVPISMGYTTSGIKVSQIASWVGLGWNLNAGGSISRSIRGMADEEAQIREFIDYTTLNGLKTSNPNLYYTHITRIAQKDYADYIPDTFNYSIDGFSGSFYLDANWNVVSIKKESEVKIAVLNGSILNGFTVTAPNGVLYTFATYESSKQRMTCGSGNPGPATYKPTSWLLTKIEHPFGDEITLTYGNSSDYFYSSSLSETYNKNYGGTPPQGASLPPEGVQKCGNSTYIKGKILTKISSNRNVGEIVFTSAQNRADVNDYKLDAITIKNSSGNQTKQFAFNYSQVQSSINYAGAATFPTTGGNDEKYRLFLDNIIEKDANGSSANGKKYSFEYIDRNSLPRRLSLAQDLLGFYNGKVNYSQLPNTHGSGYNITRGDRTFDFNYAKKGILEKVIYPTKGYTFIEYESGPSAIRVKKIKKLSESGGQENVTRYYYTSKENAVSGGTTPTQVPVGSNGFVVTKPSVVTYSYNFQGTTYTSHYNFERDEFTANGTAPLYLTNANHFLYQTVTVGYGENFEGGGVEKKFSVTTDTSGGSMHGTYILNGVKTNTSLLNGTLTQENHFKKNGTSANLVKTVDYTYTNAGNNDVNFDCFIGNVVFESPQNSSNGYLQTIGYDVNNIQTISKWRSMGQITTTVFNSTGAVTSVQTNSYNSNLAGLPSESKTTDSNGTELKTITFYPKDVLYTTSLGFDALSSTEKAAIDKMKVNMVGVPVQIKTYKNGTQFLQAKRTNYHEPFSNKILPKNIQIAKGANSLEDRILFHSYYSNGNVKEVSKKEGTHVVYIWGYNETKPIAKIENITYSEISSQVASLQNTSNLDVNAVTEQNLRNALESLRTSLPSDALMTSFTYDSLIGVTSVTDARGKTTYYQYNAFGRLEVVKDQNGNILSKNEYNYKN